MRVKYQNLRFKVFLFFLLVTVYSSLLTVSFAAHPLITDDTGTQGMGKFQLEINGEHSDNKGEKTTEIAMALSAGVMDDVDLVVSVPYLFLNPERDSNEKGIGDSGIEIKWRFYEKEGFSFALKPGVTFDTGREDKGLGDGKPSYGIVLMATKGIDSSSLHLNLGYTKNKKELRDVWHYSFAGEYGLTENLRTVANIGGETNPDRVSNTHPLFLLGGIIYSIRETLDIDFGIKAGLNRPEVDYAILTGIALQL